jgi:hypothetical protein
MWGSVTADFCRMGSSAPRPTPSLEDQGISLSVAPPSKPVRHGCPYQQLCYRRRSFRVHWCTQAPSPSNQVLSTRWRYHRGGPVYVAAALTASNSVLCIYGFCMILTVNSMMYWSLHWRTVFFDERAKFFNTPSCPVDPFVYYDRTANFRLPAGVAWLTAKRYQQLLLKFKQCNCV